MVAKRLKQFIENQNISYYAFENSIEASRGSISKAVKENKNIGSNVLENILNTYDNLNPVWLLTGNGEMLIENSTHSIINEPKSEYKKSDTKNEDLIKLLSDIIFKKHDENFSEILKNQDAMTDAEARILLNQGEILDEIPNIKKEISKIKEILNEIKKV